MRKKQNDQLKISILLFLLLVIGIGYAYLTSNLSISGAAQVTGNTWDIHFANIQIKSGSISASSIPTIDSNKTSIAYSVYLAKPGDYFEFTADIVNAGTIPGIVSLSSLTGLDPQYLNVIDYSITYDYGLPVNVNDILNDGATKTIKIRTYYKEDITKESLPSTNIDLNLVYNIQYVQADTPEDTASDIIQNLSTNNSSCFNKYIGEVTDQVGQTKTATNVYFNNCSDKRNIIFGGFCWQMIRTTETGGIKMIYNGEPVDGKCQSNREYQKGIVGTTGDEKYLANSVLYGRNFTYDKTNNTFTLVDTFTSTWSDSTYENIIGTYTCYNNSNTCTTLYSINGYKSNTTGYAAEYTIGNTNYYEIGKSPLNAQYGSPSKVGYMFNKTYTFMLKYLTSDPIKYGNSFTYDTNTNTYTLSGTTETINDWSTGYNTINNTHYTCWNASGSCNTISYIYYTTDEFATYFDMSNGIGISDAITEMLHADNVNHFNSSIKGIIDTWYAKYLSSYTNKLEDIVYCNDRTILDIGAMNPNGGNTYNYSWLNFKNFIQSPSLVCTNITDQFAMTNNKAKLTYPVALITLEELENFTSDSLKATGTWYRTLTPDYYAGMAAFNYAIDYDGSVNYTPASESGGVRPVVSLGSNSSIVSGTGSEADPWIAG